MCSSDLGMDDRATDILGGGREFLPGAFVPEDARGRGWWRQDVWGLPDGFTVQAQVYASSDLNFLEQYYKFEHDREPNQGSFLYVKEQLPGANWAWDAKIQGRVQPWFTETQSLPAVNGYLIGESLFDAVTYNAWAGAGYFSLLNTNTPLPDGEPVSHTDRNDGTGRFFLMQEAGLPFYLGPVKTEPYGKLLLAEYTHDLNGDEIGRAWGGAGLRASIPFTRLYPDVCSELFNVHGIEHKIVATADYFIAGTNEPYTRFPQLDRLNDEVSDQALRDIRFREPVLNPANGVALATSPLYDPQVYAIRRLVDDRIETLDNIEELNVDVRQRWQTKRGFPGNEHIVDWMTLDLSGTYFPAANRDNFGHPFAFLEYDYLWNIGDRTALASTGWVDPFPGGPRVFTVGAFFNRTDRTSFYLGYREIDPLSSKAVTGAVTYVLSPKYAVTASATYDFGIQEAMSNSLVFTRMGTDLQISLGFTYNAITNNFGVLFQIVPNLLPPGARPGGPMAALGQGGFLGH